MRSTFVRFIVCLSLLGLVSCAGGEDRWREEIVEVTHPDLGPRNESLHQQLGAVRRRLEATLEKSQASRTEVADAFGEMGRHYQGYSFRAAALGCYGNARRLAPDDSRWVYLPALIHIFEGRHEEAVELLEEYLLREPGSLVARLRLADSWFDLGRFDQARRRYSETRDLDPESAWAHFGLGRLAMRERNYQAATESFETALEIEPGASAIHHPLSLAYRRLGEGEKAAEHQRRAGSASVRRPDRLMAGVTNLAVVPQAHLGRGGSASAAGRYQDAVPVLRKAVQEQPEHVPSRLSLGTALAGMGADREAEEQFEIALRLAPDDPSVHYQLGSHLARVGAVNQAVTHFEKVLALDPLHLKAQLEQAQALERLGRFEAALRAFDDALRLDPQNRHALLGRAISLLSLGRLQEGTAALRGFVADDPSNLAARTNLGAALVQLGQVDEAVRHLREAIELEGAPAVLALAHYNLAWVESRRGRIEVAIGHYREALALDSSLGSAHLNLANLLSSRGEREEADFHYRKARELTGR